MSERSRQRWVALALVLWLVSLCVGCSATGPRRASKRPAGDGLASWYGSAYHGKITASGERFDMYALTAAHRTMSVGTYVRVTNLENGRSVVVRVNDRGPYVKGRVIDLSYEAARQLQMVEAGVAPVRIDPLESATVAQAR